MSDSLRDQLLGLGFKSAPKPDRKPDRTVDSRPGTMPGARRDDRRPQPRPAGKPPSAHKSQRMRPEMDLAKAYAIRAHKEKDERIETERLKQEDARQRRESRARLAELVDGKALNSADAAIARHFPYGGRIKRIHVTEAQLRALNAGELGVLQMDGRYLLVDAALLAQAEAVFPPAIALKIDPDAPADDDPYADPQYKVPDDLVW